ncbi:hypothetical protein NM208_g1401 [Fusarium decemcellulare]|uniref:Uncharacterized protein n=1 Tax=Fusarium decemcellulare TaxID=57161 RepID=A0ACC1SWE1_9HYPO|nr:hypothetical protein NM208_g1401 [Fusarium decemcellulare]
MDKAVNRPRVNKRKRVSRACDYCRARKHRCDGRHPTCSPCSAIHQPCSYGSDIKKRGLPTGYVRSLELLWALVFTVVPNSTSIVRELLPEIQFALDSRGRLVMDSALIKDPDILKHAWEGSGIQGELDQLLSSVQENSHSSAGPATITKDEDSAFDLPPHLKSFDAVQSRLADGAIPSSDPAHAENTDTLPRQLPMEIQARQQNDAAPATFPHNVRRLLDMYFAHTHCWLPIVQKHKMLELLYSPSRTALAEGGNLATFWAILALSSLQASRDPQRPVGRRSSLSTPEQIYAKARQCIPNEEARKPGHAQALLILSLFKLDQGEISACWHLIGQAVRICLDLRTTLDRRDQTMASGSDDDQNRLLCACFVLDTVVSCQLGKPPHLRTVDVKFLLPLAETGQDEWEPRTICPGESNSQHRSDSLHQPLRAISIFNRYVDLIRILNDAMLDLMASDELCTNHSLELSRWHDQLPQHCILSLPGQEQTEAVQRLSPQLLNLYLAFKGTEMFLKAQQASFLRHGPPGIGSVDVTSLSIMHLISVFAKSFGISTMPAIFMSYKAIDRMPLETINLLILAASSPPGCLPTPAEYPDYVAASTDESMVHPPLPLSCNMEDSTTHLHTPTTDLMHEHDKETWKQLFGIVELSEAGISSQKYLGDQDFLNGMEW